MLIVPNRTIVTPVQPLPGDLSQNLCFLLAMGEGGGTSISDALGITHGTFNGSIAWTDTPFGPAVRMDGSTSYIQAPANRQLNPIGASGAQTGFTVCAWVRLRVNPGGYAVLAATEDGGSGYNWEILIRSDGALAWYASGGDTDPFSPALSLNVWHHVGFAYGINNNVFFVDGVIVGTGAGFSGPSIGNGNFHLLIGGNSEFGGRFAPIDVGPVAGWSRQLDFSEIQTLYTQPDAIWLRPRKLWAIPSVTGAQTINGAGFSIPSRQHFSSSGTIGHPGDQFLVGSSGIPSRQAFGNGAIGTGNNLVGSEGIPSQQSFGRGVLTLANLIKGSYGIPSRQSFGLGALTNKNFTLFISGIDVTKYMRVNTLDITNSISQVSTAVFNYGGQDKTSPLVELVVGQPVYLYWKNVRIFGGTIDQALNTNYGTITGPNVYQITCSDFSEILDRRYVGAYFPSTGATLFDVEPIVSQIVNTFLAQDGITYTPAGTNESIANPGDIVFNWITARQAFTQLANLIQWDFQIDYFGNVTFFPNTQGTGLAPFNIADNDGHVMADDTGTFGGVSMTVEEYRGTYRNRQGVRSSAQSTPLWSDTYSTSYPGPYQGSPQPPDGIRQFFVTLFVLNSAPYVYVNDVQQTVISIDDIGTTSPDAWQWYWIPGGPGVIQNSADAPLTSGDILIVNYQSAISPIMWVECISQIAIRAAIEGNSGIYEDVEDAPNITDPGLLYAYAQGLLARYGCLYGMPVEVVYNTHTDGLFAGMIQTIQQTNPYSSGAAPFMITEVEIKEVDGSIAAGLLQYAVTADSGLFQMSPSAYFGAIVNRGQLPPPSNRMAYAWPLAPSYPGITNPGLTSGTQPQTHIIAMPAEVPQYLTFYALTPTEVNGINVALVINGSIFGGTFSLPANQQGPFTFYFGAPQVFGQGSTLALIFQGGVSGIKDGVVTLITSVVRGA